MKGLSILVLLSSGVLLCSAGPALEMVTCSENGGSAAATLAMYHINEHHDHGYKFRLNETTGYKMAKVDDGCDIEVQLNLLETVCHSVNPQFFEYCEIRGLRNELDRGVIANCTVMMTLRNHVPKVTKYECGTRLVKTDEEALSRCGDCPNLMALDSTSGLKSVYEAVKNFNTNETNQHYYILQEVGRMMAGWAGAGGMAITAEFVLVETHCPKASKIVPEACKPLCPDRAHHVFCISHYTTVYGLSSVNCEFYAPMNTTALLPDEQEPVCMPRHPAGPQGPPVPPGPLPGNGLLPPGPPGTRPDRPGPPGDRPGSDGQGLPPPPPPPPGTDQEVQPLPPFDSYHPLHPCHGINPRIHPICPWPRPDQPSPRDQA